jgi:hypothetical protein
VHDFSTNVTGCLFLASAGLLWGGWMLLPRHIGMYFQPNDFAAIRPRVYFWLWVYRFHLFGVVGTALALVALATLLTDRSERVLAWPGVAVAVAGLIVGATGSAFYYHFGVSGALGRSGESPEAAQALVNALHLPTEYVTCLVRFGRVFSGLGLFVLAFGLFQGQALPFGIAAASLCLGTAAMALTMLFPDHWALYMPIFHLQALWLALTGGVLLWSGIGTAP